MSSASRRASMVSRFHPFLAVALVVACRSGEGAATDPVDSAGVALVTGPATDRPVPWMLADLGRLGGADTGALAFAAASIHTVSTDGASRIVVVDVEGGHRVRVLDSAGTVLATFGGEGGGPGEMLSPRSVDLDRDGSLTIFDPERLALLRWDREGRPLPDLAWDPVHGMPDRGTVRRGDSVYTLLMRNDSTRFGHVLERRTPRDTVVLDSVIGPPVRMVPLTCHPMRSVPLLTGELRWSLLGDLAATTGQGRYVVDVRRGGALVRSIRRDLAPVATTPRDADRLHPDGLRLRYTSGQECVTPTAELVAKLGLASTRPLIDALRFAPDGSLWVKRWTFPDETPRIDVFDPEGRYTGTLSGMPLPLGFLDGDRVLFPVEDPGTGARVIGIFRMTKG